MFLHNIHCDSQVHRNINTVATKEHTEIQVELVC